MSAPGQDGGHPRHLVLGECVADVVTSAAGITEVYPGGSPANVAFGLGRLGRAVTLVTALGDDPHGAMVRAHLEGAGVQILERGMGRPTATAQAILDEHGAASYTFDITWELRRPVPVPVAPLHVHIGSIGAVAEPGAGVVAEVVASLHADATVSLDPNVRPALLPERAAVLRRLEALLDHADIVKASDEDMAWLYPQADPLETARRWLSAGPSVVVLTRGAAGSTALCRAGSVDVMRSAVTVVDTVGAGDSFTAALLDGLQEEGLLGAANRTALAAMPLQMLRSVAEHASRAAGITVSRAGAAPPSRAELAAGSRTPDGPGIDC